MWLFVLHTWRHFWFQIRSVTTESGLKRAGDRDGASKWETIKSLTDFVEAVEIRMYESMRKVDLLRAACCVAGADGDTSDPERRALQTLADRAGIGTASLQAMIDLAESDDKFLDSQFRVAVKKPQETLKVLFKVAIIDGRLGKDEAIVLKRLAKQVGVESEQFDAWLKQSIDQAKKKAQ
jgi:tellurite resistance protein